MMVFLLFFTGLSIWCGDFYAVPITVAFMVACFYSIFVLRGRTMEERFNTLAQGAAQGGVMLMIWIFVLAGAFAATAKQMGAIDAAVSLTQWVLPDNLFLCGMFVAACFISLSVGTSVGTIAALTPLACGLAERSGESLPLLVAVVVGGAYFGDNLSFISDTTIMATRTQGCEMKDKFRYNLRLALPAAFICLVIYTLLGGDAQGAQVHRDVNMWLVLPYIFIIVSALMGMNVLLLLAIGTCMAGVMGLGMGMFDFTGWLSAMNQGVMGMGELIVVTLMAACMVEVIRKAGGITFLMNSLSRVVRGRKGAELSIAGLVMLTDFCTANNTIAILSVGQLVKEISDRYGIDPRRSASLLDTFSCTAQGIIPYGAQLLIASSLAQISPLEIIPYLFYPFLLGGVSLIYIFIKK